MRLFRDLVYVAIHMYHDQLIDDRQELAKQQQWDSGDEFRIHRDSRDNSSAHAMSSVMSGLEQRMERGKRFSHYHITTLHEYAEHLPEGLHRRKATTINPKNIEEGQTSVPFS